MTFDEWARQRLPALVRFAVVLTGDRALAEDIVQEVAIRAYGRWSRIVALEAPEAYLRRMVTNEFLSWRRRPAARVTPSPDIGADPVAPDHLAPNHLAPNHLAPDLAVPDFAEAHAQRADVHAQLARLPRRQRAVLVLRYYEHLTDNEIAEVLDCPPGTVRSLASRALATLRVNASVDAIGERA